jgi:hypothetical protein
MHRKSYRSMPSEPERQTRRERIEPHLRAAGWPVVVVDGRPEEHEQDLERVRNQHANPFSPKEYLCISTV